MYEMTVEALSTAAMHCWRTTLDVLTMLLVPNVATSLGDVVQDKQALKLASPPGDTTTVVLTPFMNVVLHNELTL